MWNERFTFARAGTEGNELILRIWNANALTSDKCIGSATVRLDAVFKNETDDVDVEVLDTKGRPSGVLNLVLTFTPDTSETRRRAERAVERCVRGATATAADVRGAAAAAADVRGAAAAAAAADVRGAAAAAAAARCT